MGNIFCKDADELSDLRSPQYFRGKKFTKEKT